MNEMVSVEGRLYVRGANSIAKHGHPEIENSERFVVKPFPQEYLREEESIDGYAYTSLRIPTAIFALGPGEFEVGPLVTTVGITNSRRNTFVTPRDRFAPPQMISSDNVLTLKIKPFPEEGKPGSFANAVGNFNLEVDASPTKLRVGDPISVDIRITGTGNFDSLPAPSFPESPGWKTYTSNRVEGVGRGGLEQSVTYNQVVIPMEEHSELPTLELSFFNAETEAYVVRRSEPISLEVTPDSGALAWSGGSSLGASGISGEQLQDILHIHSGGPGWHPMTASVLERPGFWLIQFLPAVIFFSLVSFGVARGVLNWMEAKKAGREMSLEEVKAKIGSDRIPRGQFYQIVLEYFERWRARHGDLMSRLSEDARAALDQLNRVGNAYLYSGAAGDGQPVSSREKKEALKALDELESITNAA